MLRISLLVIFGVIAVAGVIAIILISKSAPYTDIVGTKYGPIRGEELSFDGTKYKAFKGVPYAAPPLGDLKFKAPQPPAKWTEVKDTRAYGNICHQPQRTLFSSEDCLTLNVFTHSLGGNNLKPVLVWIHGGAFFAGDGTDSFYGPQYLIQEDIVVVTINYRLGPLGFLATNTSEATGNWGMKDQVAALKWVQENIAQFGGDPKQVTIYGESAGGASVHLHLFSPLSKGLFHQAIPASGSAASLWALRSPDEMVRYSQNMARILGASESEIGDPAKRMEFLRKADSKAMTERQGKVLDKADTTNPMFNPIPFTPNLENKDTEGAFITEDPRKLLAEGRYNKVPLMMGLTDLEGGLAQMGFGKNITKEYMNNIEKNVCQILPEPLKTSAIKNNGCPDIAAAIRDVYFNGQPFDTSLLNFVYLFGDVFMMTDVHFSQRWHARNSNAATPLYNYFFCFDGEWNVLKKLFGIGLPGATHGDDLGYVFKPKHVSLPDLPATSPEVITKNRMINLITNFVKFGNPTPSVSALVPVKWEPATPNEAKTLNIDKDLKLEKGFLKARMDMWDQMYTKYTGKPLFP